MTRLFYRNTKAVLPFATGGDGIHIFDRQGRSYIDACGGVVVSSLGHNHPRVIAAIRRQVDTLSYAHAGAFTTEPAEELADYLVENSPGMSRAYFMSGGSEIMEVALKTAYQYFVEIGKPEKRHFISRRQNYHGSTLTMLALSGNPQRRDTFLPILGPSHFVSPCYAYRDQLAGEREADYAERLARELEAKIRELGAENVAGFVAETVVGSTSGAVPPVEGYFEKVRAVCDRYGILLILDEVMCGSGRTGHLFACVEDGVRPDIVTIGKGLAGGYQPLSAMLVNERVHGAIAAGSGILNNGQTFVSHALACAAGLEVQRVIAEEDLLANVRARGEQLRARLGEAFAGHPNVGDIRGRGLFVGVELVADRATKEPLAPSAKTYAKVKAEALARGLMVYPMGGTIDGTRGDHVLFAPPFMVTEAQIDQIVTIFADAVNRVFS